MESILLIESFAKSKSGEFGGETHLIVTSLVVGAASFIPDNLLSGWCAPRRLPAVQ